jgi:hypothetical protein
VGIGRGGRGGGVFAGAGAGAIVGDVLTVIFEGDRGVEAFVVGVVDDGADVDVLGEGFVGGGEVERAFGLGVGGEPVFAVDLLVVGDEGRREVGVVGAGVLGDVEALAEDDFVVGLVDPDLALEVALAFFEGFGSNVEDVGVEGVDVLGAEVGDVVFGQLGCGEDEGEALLDVFEVVLGHDDALDGGAGSEGDLLGAVALLVEGDVGDLAVLAVGLAGVVVDGVELDVAGEDVAVEGVFELGLAGTHFVEDLVGGDAGGRSGVEGAEAALGEGGGGGEESCEGKGAEVHRVKG